MKEKCDAFFNQWQTPEICIKESKKEKCLCCLEVSVNRFENNHFQNIRSEISGKCIYLYFSLGTIVVILWGFHREEIYTNFALYSFFKEISCVIFINNSDYNLWKIVTQSPEVLIVREIESRKTPDSTYLDLLQL